MAPDGQNMTAEQLVKENRRLSQELQSCREANAEMLVALGHKLRTPLSAIEGLAELMALTQLDSQQENYVASIITSAKTLQEAIDDTVARPKQDARAGLAECGYRTAELLSEVSNVMALRAEDKGLLLRIDARPGMPAGLWGDVVRLKQVLLNLLATAIEHSDRGRVLLQLDAEPCKDGTVMLTCRVEDSSAGAGRKPGELREEALLALRQASPGLEAGGRIVTVLGGKAGAQVLPGGNLAFTLSVPQKVVDPKPLARVERPESLRVLVATGAGHAESVAGKLACLQVPYEILVPGARPRQTGFTHCIYDHSAAAQTLRSLRAQLPDCVFAALRGIRDTSPAAKHQDAVLYTPLLVTGLARLLNRHAAEEPAGGKAAAKVAAQPETFAVRDTLLLVVDDNEINLMVSEEMLKALGATVECADGGQTALDMCDDKQYDVIFMDHMMPDIDGVEVTRRLRSQPGPNRQTPIVALTANVMDDMQSYYVRHGMDDYLGKPVEFDDLRQVLCRWLPPEKVVAEQTAAPAHQPV